MPLLENERRNWYDKEKSFGLEPMPLMRAKDEQTVDPMSCGRIRSMHSLNRTGEIV